MPGRSEMAVAWGGERMLDAMGHEFGDDLVCECGVTSDRHQEAPTRCERIGASLYATDPRIHTSSEDPLSNMRVSLQIPLRRISSDTGIPLSMVGKAVVGDVGGHGKPTVAVRDRISRYLQSKAEEE